MEIGTIRRLMVDRLRAEISLKPLVVLASDEQMQVMAAVWEFLRFETERDASLPMHCREVVGMTVIELIERVWAYVSIDFQHARELVGPAFPVRDVAIRISRLGIGYPDGTIHRNADNWLASRAVYVTNLMYKNATEKGR